MARVGMMRARVEVRVGMVKVGMVRVRVEVKVLRVVRIECVRVRMVRGVRVSEGGG